MSGEDVSTFVTYPLTNKFLEVRKYAKIEWEEGVIVTLSGGSCIIYYEEVQTWFEDGLEFLTTGLSNGDINDWGNLEVYLGFFIAPSMRKDVLEQQYYTRYSHGLMTHMQYTMTWRARLGVWCPWNWVLLAVDRVRKSWIQRAQRREWLCAM